MSKISPIGLENALVTISVGPGDGGMILRAIRNQPVHQDDA